MYVIGSETDWNKKGVKKHFSSTPNGSIFVPLINILHSSEFLKEIRQTTRLNLKEQTANKPKVGL